MRKFLPAALVCFPVLFSSASAAENLARGRPATFHPAPNYPLSTDPDDARQLTDGKFAPKTVPMWADTASVAWRREEMALITIDLGETLPVGEVAFYSAARRAAAVEWATNLVVYLSNDGEHWQEAEDICSAERARGTFPEPTPGDAYRTHRFVSSRLNLQARYVAIAAKGAPYIAVDEVEILRGEESAASLAPQITGVDGIRKAFKVANIWGSVKQRVLLDRVAMRRAIQKATVDAATKEQLMAVLQKAGEPEALPANFDPATYRAVFPLTKGHEQVFALQAALWREGGQSVPLFHTAPRYDWLPLIHPLPRQEASLAKLAFHQARGERRSALLLISNPYPEPVTFRVGVEAEDAVKHAINLYDSRWTDTPSHLPVADALLPLVADEVTVPAGMTQKVWVSLDTSQMEQGSYEGALRFFAKGLEHTVPLRITVSPVILKPAKLATGMWDYVLKQNVYGVTPENHQTAANVARAGGVNVAWIPRAVLPWPTTADFAAEGADPLNFSALKERIQSTWPDADTYAFFLGEAMDLGGVRLGAEEFPPVLSAWLAQFEAALREAGVPREKVMLLTIDEPLNEEKASQSLAWTKAIRATGSKLKVFTDPVWLNFTTLPKEYIEAADIICPNIQFLRREGAAAFDYFERLRKSGKELWFYLCSGPARESDPVSYYRLAHWFVFHHKGSGIGFWSLSDTGGAVSSWLGHTATNTAYTPLFLGPDSVDISIHWEAMREGRLDFTYFTMLREARENHPECQAEIDALLAEVGRQLERLPNDTGNGALLKDGFWPEAKSSEPIEDLRLRALVLLEKIQLRKD